MDAEPVAESTRAMLAGDHATKALGIEVDSAVDGRAAVRMTVTPAMVNGHGMAHGGYVFLLADTAFACACNSRGPVTVAAGAEISFTASAYEGEQLHAEAVERTRYGRSGIYDVTVRRGPGPDDEVIAEFRGRSRALRS